MIHGFAASLWLLQASGALELLGEGSGILVMLAAAVLVYRTYRERYLAVWIGGWLVYFLYRTGQMASETGYGQYGLHVLAQLAFVLSVAFFVSAVFYYTDAKRYLAPLAVVTAFAAAVTIIRAVWFPYSPLLSFAVHLLYRVMTTAGAIRLALFSRGRRELGPWLMTVMLLFLHLDDSGAVHGFAGVDTMVEVFFGLSMLVIVLDDSRARTRRLALVNVITTAIAEAQDSGSMMAIALGELKALLNARSAWFRLVQGDQLILAQHIGLTPEFADIRRSIPLNDRDIGRVFREGVSSQIRRNMAGPELSGLLDRAEMEHVILIPVTGKNSVIGVLSLGMPRPRAYTQDEMRFLTSTANQLGIAVENLRMFEQILRSQRQWVSTFDSIDDAILVHDAAGNIIKVNRTLLARLGHKFHAEVVHRNCAEVLPNSTGGCPYCRRTDEYVEMADPCFGGYSLVSTSSYSEDGGVGTGTIHIVKDTTERRAAEERYRLLFEEVQEGVFISTAEGRLLACNNAFVKMMGYSSRAEVLRLDIGRDLYDSPLQRELFLQSIEKDGYVRNLEVSLRGKDGRKITALENSFLSRDGSGYIERIQGFLVDITEKKRVEDEIKRRNRELHALNSIAVIATQSFDLDEVLNVTLRQVSELLSADAGSIVFYDAENCALVRKAAYGVTGRYQAVAIEVTMPPEVLQKMIATRVESVTEKQQSMLPPMVQQLIAAEGLASWISVNMWSQNKLIGMVCVSSHKAEQFNSRDESLLVAIARQLATTVEKVRLYEETSRAYEDLRRTQEQLLQSEKMSAVGQLISGVAHELNNPLTAILGYAQLLENEPIDERSRDFVQKLYKQAQRTHRVVQNLLSFARQRRPVKQHCDLRRVMDDTLALRDYDLKLNNIVVTREFANDLPHVIADSHQLEQVFLNVVNNAVDAMLENSRGGEVRVRIFVEADQVCAEFRDSGPGIKNPKRIFDPFFTTKKVGKGTGLGLSICYGILKEHGGDIIAFNHAEGGAVFQVRLPVAERVAQSIPQLGPIASANFVGGRILLVDDEEPILEFETEVLRGAGAEVFSKTSGEEAVALLQSEDFDAIIIDCKMPGGWSGQDIYRWVRDNRIGMERRIVFTVSHAADADMRSFLQLNNVPCIVKPFEVTELLSMVRRIVQRVHAARA